MRTVRLPTPFDDPRRRAALATPTCCCCCCCLVTTLTSTAMTAVHVNETARARETPPLTRAGLCVAAVLGLALAVLGLVAGVVSAVSGQLPDVALGIAVLGVGTALIALAHAGGPSIGHRDVGRAAALVLLVAVSFTLEVFTLGFLFYGQLLAIPMPILGAYLLRKRMRERS